jgi:hypothetical protein
MLYGLPRRNSRVATPHCEQCGKAHATRYLMRDTAMLFRLYVLCDYCKVFYSRLCETELVNPSHIKTKK